MSIYWVGVRVGDCFGSIHVVTETLTSYYFGWWEISILIPSQPNLAMVGTELGNTSKKVLCFTKQ